MKKAQKSGISANTLSSGAAVGNNEENAEAIVSTCFPAGSCETTLPVSESFHDVTFGEFKRLNLTVDNLRLPIVLGDVDLGRLAKIISEGKLNTRSPSIYSNHQNTLASSTQSLVHATRGGVPLSKYLDRDLTDVSKPLFDDVHIQDVYEFVHQPHVDLGDKPGHSIKPTLSDNAKADLVAGVPVLVHARVGNTDRILRLMPKLNESKIPLQNDYHVGTVDSFMRLGFPFNRSTGCGFSMDG